MKKIFIVSVLFLSLTALAQEADDYGYSEDNPILVGTENLKNGPANQRAYLNLLTGPNGEEVSYQRLGSCCEFTTENSPFGGGLLDRYEVNYDGLPEPVYLYLNMYDPDPDGEIKAPIGFVLKEG